MSRLEELRQRLAASAEATTSEGLIQQALYVLEGKVEYVTPEQEVGIGKGLADIAAGRVVSYEEWRLKSRRLIEELKQKEAARNAA